MFERFTSRARQVVVYAQDEARLLRHNYIGTEHILLGLLREPESVGARALQSVGVDFDDVRARVRATVGEGKGTPSGHIPFTPRAKKILELSLREALQLGHNYIGTEHILLGLVREGDGVAAHVLINCGVDLAGLRSIVAGMVPAGSPGERGRLRRWFRPRSGSSTDAPDDVRTTAAADRSLEEAQRLAGETAVGSHHLLLAALVDPTSAAAKALNSLGVDLDRARAALRTVDVTGTTDELPEEAGRRRMRMRLSEEALVLETDEAAFVEKARRAFAVLGGDVEASAELSGDHPLAAGLADVWQAWQAALESIAMRAIQQRPAPSGEPPASGTDR